MEEDWESSDEEYAPIVATAWGDQAGTNTTTTTAENNENEDNTPKSWNDLIDPTFKVQANGLGGGNLHRKGRNYKPVDEQVILNQRHRIPNPPKKKKGESRTKRGGGGPPLTKLRSVSSQSRKPERTAQPPLSTTRRPPPSGNNAWTSGSLVDVPFWEQQDNSKDNYSNNSTSTTNTTMGREGGKVASSGWSNWGAQQQQQEQRSNVSTSWDTNASQASKSNSGTQRASVPDSWDNPNWNATSQQQGQKQQQQWSSSNNNTSSNNGWNHKPDVPTSWGNVATETPKEAPRQPPSTQRNGSNADSNSSLPARPALMRPPPGLFKNAIANISEKSRPPGLSPIPLHHRSTNLSQPHQQQQQQHIMPQQQQPSQVYSPQPQQPQQILPSQQYQEEHQRSATTPDSTMATSSPSSLQSPTEPRQSTKPTTSGKKNPVVITINIELETGKKIPVSLRMHDDPHVLAQQFSFANNIHDINVTNALKDLFSKQQNYAIQKRNVHNNHRRN
ncbi:hypothetical protein INT45_010925 [Circinella minor]|uniref:Uncharacterized protein n=1 Tax=Circinella minor TaxID=1195481 RepID=A0A8H7S2A0_9FUNG|nr:hypothetical protein INT45_010925 [Circinella minor]